jgi:nucleotide-binding universal stress UspA family protein
MTETTSHRFTIVVGIDFEADGDRALDTALELAETRPSPAELHVVHVHYAPVVPAAAAEPDMRQTTLDAIEHRCKVRVAELQKRNGSIKTEPIASHFRVGRPAEQIVQLAADLDADLVVVGTHGRKGMKRALLGSVAADVLRIARCPVFVVRPKDHEDLGDVPEIEPPCPDCVTTRKSTGGKEWWCKRHGTERRPLAHRYHYVSSPSHSPAYWSGERD